MTCIEIETRDIKILGYITMNIEKCGKNEKGGGMNFLTSSTGLTYPNFLKLEEMIIILYL